MAASAHAFVLEAHLELGESVDPAAVGAAVTTALCGHWQHDGLCRWPHNNEIRPAAERFEFRTLFAAGSDEEAEVRRRIEAALRGGDDWAVVRVAPRPLAPSEVSLAERLISLPRRQAG